MSQTSYSRNALVYHLEKNHLIRDIHHGFRKRKSCLINLLEFLDKVTRAVDEEVGVDAGFLDFAKAFNKVPHGIEKLKAHGVGGKLLLGSMSGSRIGNIESAYKKRTQSGDWYRTACLRDWCSDLSSF